MFINIINNLFVGQAAPTSDAGGGLVTMLVMIGGLFFVMYFFMIRPQSKKQKALESMRNELKKNDKVLTTGGIIGFVSKIKDSEITLKVDDNTNTKITFMRGAIVHIFETSESEQKEDDSQINEQEKKED